MDTGELIVLKGTMFGGKTTTLITIARKLDSEGRSMIALKPKQDTRDEEDFLVTHVGRDTKGTAQKYPCVSIATAADLLFFGAEADIILIDEVHLFAQSEHLGIVRAILRLRDESGKTVIVSGLDLTSKREPFPPMPELLCHANSVMTYNGRCECGAVARYSERLVPSEERIVIGGKEAYRPRCPKCHVSR